MGEAIIARMYSENPFYDMYLFSKAFLSNQLARIAPALYVKLTRQTGRGKLWMSGDEDGGYFLRCYKEYFELIGLNIDESGNYLRGKKVLEYGPGDILGIALLMYAHGADSVDCVDRFPIEKRSPKNIEVYRILLDSLDGIKRIRGNQAFRISGRIESGFNPQAISFSVTPDGLAPAERKYDLVISRAVLEHVNDLERTLVNICRVLKQDGISIHHVDLKSHGLDRYQAFDFLTWPEILYRSMYSHKGFPNRWRIDKYKEWIEKSGLRCNKLIPLGRLEEEKIEIIKPMLAKQFRQLSTEELSWLEFWMVLEHDRKS
jgi:SAM-dependent methyltransferase